MNRFLADLLAALNIALALVIVAVAAQIGGIFIGGIEGLVLGGIVGVALASLSCGTLAFLALIEGHLRRMAEDAEAGRGSVGRQEPRF